MKKVTFWKLLALTLAFAAAGTVVACKNDDSSSSGSGDSTVETQSSIELSKTMLTLDLLEEATLFAETENLTGALVWSSSNPEVASVDNGKVVAIKEGTATITVVCGEYQAQCVVTVVASGVRPTLEVTGTEKPLSILKGNTFPLAPVLAYNGEEADASFTYSYEGDTVSVSEEGEITALKAGETEVTVKAVWGNFEEYAVVKVQVVLDSAIVADRSEITLKSRDKVGQTLNFTVKVDGQTVQSPALSYEYDDTLISVSQSGAITNVTDQTTETYVTVKYTDGATELLTRVKINLEFEILDKTDEFDSYRFVASKYCAGSTFEDCFGDGSKVTKVFDLADLKTNLLNANGALVFDANTYGERTWVVYGDNGYACYVKGVLITAEISTAQQFAEIFLASASVGYSSVPEETYYGGYYVLTADIDMNGMSCSSKHKFYHDLAYFSPVDKAGFNGVIDGQGHTVKNFSLNGSNASLFGTIGKEGVVKNIGFILKSAQGLASGVIAVNGFGTVENVFVAGDLSKASFPSTYFGGLIYAPNGATIKNCVSYITGVLYEEGKAGSMVGWLPGDCKFENCYAVYGDNMTTRYTSEGLNYYSALEYEWIDDYDYTGYESSLWDTNGSIPVFKTAKSEFDNLKKLAVMNVPTLSATEGEALLFSNVSKKKSVRITKENGGVFTGATFASADTKVAVISPDGVLTGRGAGKTTITVTPASGSPIELTVRVYEYHEIGTVEAFINAFTTEHYSASAGTTDIAGNSYYGAYQWYALTADLDFGRKAVTCRWPAFVGDAKDNAGFYGVFDGQGHTIRNFDDAWFDNEMDKMSNTSFFGTIGKEGVVKNVAFIPTCYFGWPAGVVAYNVFGTLENVFVAYEHASEEFKPGKFGALAYAADGATVKNCVVYMGGFANENANASPFIASLKNTTVENCYAVCGENVSAPSGINGLTVYDEDEYQTQTYDYTGFDSAIWCLDGSLPVMHSTLAQFDIDATKTAILADETITVSINEFEKGYAIITASAGTLTKESVTGKTAYSFVAEKTLCGADITFTFYMFGCVADTLVVTVEKMENTMELNAFEANIFTNKDGGKTWQILGKDGTALVGAQYASTNKSVATVNANGLVTAVGTGRTAINVVSDAGVASVEIKVYHYNEISTREQFINVFTVTNYANPIASTAVAENTRWGDYEWYALTADINFEAYAISTKHAPYDPAVRVASDVAGFQGVFDGQGHVLKNYDMYMHGTSLFGTLGKNGVIKNIALMPKTFYGQAVGVLCYSAFGTFENVFVSMDMQTSAFNNYTFGVMSYWSDGATFKNCVVYLGGVGVANKTNGFVQEGKNKGTFENCYMVYGVNTVKPADIKGVTYYTLEEYQSATYDYTGYDETLWDISSGLPVMKSTLSFLTLTPSKTTVQKGSTFTATVPYLNDNQYEIKITGDAKAVEKKENTPPNASTVHTFEVLANATGKITLDLYAYGRLVKSVEITVA